MSTRRIFLVIIFSLLVLSPGSFAQGYSAIQPRGPAVETKVSIQPAAFESEVIPLPAKIPAKNLQTEQPLPKAPAVLSLEQTTEDVVPYSDKKILVSLADQNLKYFEGTGLVGEFKISSGLPRTPTPPGQYSVLAKKPLVHYIGPDYNFPRTKWNLLFKKTSGLDYYIHGAYWHNNFGRPMSHGCINVSYANMETLYNWADVGTKISIQ